MFSLSFQPKESLKLSSTNNLPLGETPFLFSMEKFLKNFGFYVDINAFHFADHYIFPDNQKGKKKILFYTNYDGFFLHSFSYVNILLLRDVILEVFFQKNPFFYVLYAHKIYIKDIDPFFYGHQNNGTLKEKIITEPVIISNKDVSFQYLHHEKKHENLTKQEKFFQKPQDSKEELPCVSLSGKTWILHECPEKDSLFLQQTYGISDFMARLALNRMHNLGEHESIFCPLLKSHMEDPSFLPDAEKAYEHGYECLMKKQPLAIWGDYDVDGACASALMIKAFRHLGLPVISYIPDRFQEGYGPNINGLLSLKDRGYSNVFIVDCGTSALTVMEEAKNAGISVSIIDHHHVGATSPNVRAFVNPKRWDYEGPKIFRDLCAGALVFMFLVGFMRFLREKKFFSQENIKEPDLFSWLDLVALSTICDMMPLRHLNRAFVKQGLKVMQNRQNVGLTGLIDASGIRDIPNPIHIGYTIGPRINAGGRIGDSSLGVQLLSCEDRLQSLLLAGELSQLNKERQIIERATLEEAMGCAQEQKHQPYIFVTNPQWHEGILGIISSNLKEYFSKLAFVMTKKGDLYKGSARSVPGVDVSKIIEEACEANLLITGGGHPMAGGLSIHEEKIPLFLNFLNEFFIKRGVQEQKAELPIDMVITLEQLRHPEFFNAMERLSPFGADYPQPRFLLPRLLLKHIKLFGHNHIRMTGQQANGLSQNLLCFRSVEKPMGQWLLNYKGQIVDCAISVQVDNRWGYQRTLLILDDIRP